MSGPPLRTRDRGAPRLRRGATNVGGCGGHIGAPTTHARSRSATAPPGRDERWGVWGPYRGPHYARAIEERHGSAGARRTLGGVGAISGPPLRTRDRGAPRLRRGATSVGGCGGHIGAPTTHARSRSATAPPGRDERWGVWGPYRGPHY